MKSIEVIEMSNDELAVKLNELKEELFRLRFSNATEQLQDNSLISKCKKDIARVLTILRDREIKGIVVETVVAEKKEAKKDEGLTKKKKATAK